MRAPDGVVYSMTGRLIEFDRPHRLVFMTAALDIENGGKGKPMFEVLNTVTFDAVGKRTEIALVAEVTSATADAPRYLAGMTQGWSQSLDRLAVLVAGF